MPRQHSDEFFASLADTYDFLQPLRIEMYHFYHDLALDFVPFETSEAFRMLDLGCGTGTFLNSVLQRFPKAQCSALDYSEHMLEKAMEKVSAYRDRVEFHQRDLNEGLPNGLGSFHLVVSFSTIHHLQDESKIRLFNQIHQTLKEQGWFFLIDAMRIYFDDDVFRIGMARQRRREEERFARVGMGVEEIEKIRSMKSKVRDDSPEKDRIARLSLQLEWLREAGFRSVDHVWHFWMEHFIIARK